MGRLFLPKKNFTYNPSFVSQGEHRVNVIVKKGSQKERVNWRVVVNNVPTYNYPNLVTKSLQVFFPAFPRALTPTYFNFVIRNIGLENADEVTWVFDPLHEELDENEFSEAAIMSEDTIVIEPDSQVQINVKYTYESPYEGEIFVKVTDEAELETEDSNGRVNISVTE